MNAFYFAAFLAIFAQAAFCQTYATGLCNKSLPTVRNFNVQKYAGRWYEHEKYPFALELGGKCVYAEYGFLQNDQLSVKNYQVNQVTGLATKVNGTAKVVDSGKLKVTYEGLPLPTEGVNYWVLDTDYNTYSVVYSCADVMGAFNTQALFVFTRERNPSQQVVQRARQVVEANGFAVSGLQKTDQASCNHA